MGANVSSARACAPLLLEVVVVAVLLAWQCILSHSLTAAASILGQCLLHPFALAVPCSTGFGFWL